MEIALVSVSCMFICKLNRWASLITANGDYSSGCMSALKTIHVKTVNAKLVSVKDAVCRHESDGCDV
jgi:hypothetical protein